jgi:hypothetical protein
LKQFKKSPFIPAKRAPPTDFADFAGSTAAFMGLAAMPGRHLLQRLKQSLFGI